MVAFRAGGSLSLKIEKSTNELNPGLQNATNSLSVARVFGFLPMAFERPRQRQNANLLGLHVNQAGVANQEPKRCASGGCLRKCLLGNAHVFCIGTRPETVATAWPILEKHAGPNVSVGSGLSQS